MRFFVGKQKHPPMKQLLLLLLSFFSASLRAQDYAAIDRRARNVPDARTYAVPQLARALCQNLPDEKAKLRAIYTWITHHIEYRDSTDEAEIWATPEDIQRQRPEQVLTNRTAVCQGYANLFCALARAAGLRCEVVKGIVKDPDGSVPRIGHAWTAARADGEWHLLDPTWGVPQPGDEERLFEKYFLSPPKRFVLNHLPDDPMWQLLPHPVEEQLFRKTDDWEISQFLEQKNGDTFSFQDTLNLWLSMDSVVRMRSMENRILRFNGSNERAIFELGQTYFARFFDLRSALDSLADQSILDEKIRIDTAHFLAQVALLEHYHERTRDLFGRLRTPERVARAEKFYDPKEVASITAKLRGDLWTAVFENRLHDTPAIENETQLALLRIPVERADAEYTLAQRGLDCGKFASSCFEIWHNRSLMHLQLAQRQVRYAQILTSGQPNAEALGNSERAIRNARAFFLRADQETAEMSRRPPVFEFVRERQLLVKQGLLTLRVCEVRAERLALNPKLESLLSASKIAEAQAKPLLAKMTALQSTWAALADSVEGQESTLSADFVQVTLYNLHLEGFALHFNLSNLLFEMALQHYERALRADDWATQKEAIRSQVAKALSAAQKAQKSMLALEKSARMTPEALALKKQQVNKLNKAVRELLNTLDNGR
jgi:hypothetical protein